MPQFLAAPIPSALAATVSQQATTGCFREDSLDASSANGLAFHSSSRWRRRQAQLPLCSISASRAQGNAGPKAPSLASPQQPQQNFEFMPVGTTRGRGPDKAVLRYVWDGSRIKAVDESMLGTLATAQGRFSQWLSGMLDNLHRAFLPDAKDVTPDYWEWLRWRLTQRFFSSTMQNLSTQSLLLALGMGAQKTIAASAAINWLLKDGVGRIARMTVATNFGQSFDSDLKRIRFMTSIIFEATISCEFITPFFPQYFLPLASIANVGKAIALAAFVSTTPAFQQALCNGGNLADLTAKNQAQHMIVDMLSLGVSASLMFWAKNLKFPAMLPLCAFPFLAVGDLYAIYRELKSVQLKTLNTERAEMVTDAWLRTGRVPTAAEISARENLLLPPAIGEHGMPLRVQPLPQLLRHPSELGPLMKQYHDTKYMMALKSPGAEEMRRVHPLVHLLPPRLQGAFMPHPEVGVSLSEEARGADIMTAILEAAYCRQAIAQRKASNQQSSSSGVGSERLGSNSRDGGMRRRKEVQQVSSTGGTTGNRSSGHEQAGSGRGGRSSSQGGAGPGEELSRETLKAISADAHKRAVKDAPAFIKAMTAVGWKIKPFLLSTSQKEGYVLLSGGAS